MRVRWTTDAADDLERIDDYIAESRPESARRVARSLVDRIATLETFPISGGLVVSGYAVTRTWSDSDVAQRGNQNSRQKSSCHVSPSLSATGMGHISARSRAAILTHLVVSFSRATQSL